MPPVRAQEVVRDESGGIAGGSPQFRSIEIEFSFIVPAGALILLSNQMNFFARASYRSIIRAGKRKGARCTSSRRRRGAAGSASR